MPDALTITATCKAAPAITGPLRHACKRFDPRAFAEGHLTPVFFGSALKNFGVGDLLNALGAIAPPPRAQTADKRTVEAAGEVARRLARDRKGG